jgi:pimeloyl-ACP methyl ester carboxylesterase
VVLISPYESMTAVAQRHYPWLPVGLLLKHPFDSESRAPRIRAPLLAIAGGRDRIIPPAHSRKLVEVWGGPKRFVELGEADHNDISGAPKYWPAIDGFLREIRE